MRTWRAFYQSPHSYGMRKKESDWMPLPDTLRKQLVALLNTLCVPVRSDLDERNSGSFEIRIYQGDEMIDHLKLTGFNGILNVPGINTALRFSNSSPRQWDLKCEALLSPLFPQSN